MTSHSKKTKKLNNGFTLAEVAIATLLMVIAMVPILKALGGAHRLDAKIEQRTRSLQLAQAKLEDIKARSIYNYDDNFNDYSSPLEGHYLCKVDDMPVSGPLVDALRRIVVSVGYDQNSNHLLEEDEVEVTLNTLLARRWL